MPFSIVIGYGEQATVYVAEESVFLLIIDLKETYMSVKTSLITVLSACVLLLSYASAIHAGDDTRFTLKDGVIDDAKCGLQWLPAPDQEMTHYEAEEYVRNLSIAGGGWRLPTRAELRSIYDASKPGLADPLFKVSGWLIWTSEVDADDPSLAWYFNFYSGGEYKYTRRPNCNFYLHSIAVRSRRLR